MAELVRKNEMPQRSFSTIVGLSTKIEGIVETADRIYPSGASRYWTDRMTLKQVIGDGKKWHSAGLPLLSTRIFGFYRMRTGRPHGINW